MQAIHADRHVGLLLLVLISADMRRQILVKTCSTKMFADGHTDRTKVMR